MFDGQWSVGQGVESDVGVGVDLFNRRAWLAARRVTLEALKGVGRVSRVTCTRPTLKERHHDASRLSVRRPRPHRHLEHSQTDSHQDEPLSV